MDHEMIARLYGPTCQVWGAKYTVPTNLLLAVIRQESSGNPLAVSSCGARGLMQVMKGALDDYNRLFADHVHFDQLFLYDVAIKVGAGYLSLLLKRFGPDVALAVAAYNQGAARVDRDHTAGKWYADSVLKHLEKFDNLPT